MLPCLPGTCRTPGCPCAPAAASAWGRFSGTCICRPWAQPQWRCWWSYQQYDVDDGRQTEWAVWGSASYTSGVH
jgi:hypothetical protein